MHVNPHEQYQMQQMMLQQQSRQMHNAQPMMNVGNVDPAMMMALSAIMSNPALLAQLTNAQGTQMQMPSQRQIPQQQMVNTSRYGGGPITPQPMQPQQVINPAADGSRFSVKKEEEVQEETEVSLTSIPKLVVSTKQGHYPLTKKLGIAPKVTGFSTKQLHTSDTVGYCFSILEAAQQVVDQFDSIDETKNMIFTDSVIVDDGFSVTTNIDMLTNLFQDDVKGLYKRLRSAYSDVTDIDVAIMLNRIDERFTELTNDYLKTHLKVEISIDRFSMDFNDLLKILRDSFEDEEDDLWEFLSKEIKESYELMTKVQPEGEERKMFRMLSGISLVCFKEHSFKSGLTEVKKQITQIDPVETNNLFLLTLAAHIFEISDRKIFYFHTYDRELFKFTLNNKNEVFVERK